MCKACAFMATSDTPLTTCAKCCRLIPLAPLFAKAMGLQPAPKRPYALSENDRRFLKRMAIAPEV